MEKFTPQPEPPGHFSALAWITFIFEWAVWLVTLPIQIIQDMMEPPVENK